MLKIKGLAEMPEQNIAGSVQMSKSLSISSDKAELLTSTESTWGPDSHSSPAPLSPSMRRKRLRKSSTGSGSGSTGTGFFRMWSFLKWLFNDWVNCWDSIVVGGGWMSMEHWRNDADSGKLMYWGGYLFHFHFVHHRLRVARPAIGCGEARDWVWAAAAARPTTSWAVTQLECAAVCFVI